MPKRTRKGILESYGRLAFGFDYASDGSCTCDYLRSEIYDMDCEYRSGNLKPLTVKELSTILTTFVGTLLYSHTKENNMLQWVRSGLYLSKTDFRDRDNPSAFAKMILNMKLPTQDDVNRCQQRENSSGSYPWESSTKSAFYGKADRLFTAMEISLKMYWMLEAQSGGGKQPMRRIPAHYGDGSDKPFLMRMEALEDKLKVFNIDDPLDVELRFKLIVRHFLRRKIRLYILYLKCTKVLNDWAYDVYLNTARQSSGHLMLP